MKIETKRWIVSLLVLCLFSFLAAGSFGGDSDDDKEAKPDEDKVTPVDELTDEDRYLSLMAENANNIGEALIELGELASKHEYSDEWTFAAAAQIALIRYYADEAEEIVPHEKHKKAHELYLKGTQKYRESMDYFVEGIDELDESKIEKAGKLMNEGSEYVLKASEEMQK